MLVRFWGTRGSLPVAQRSEAIRAKLVRALLAADGRKFAGEADAEAFLDETLLTVVPVGLGRNRRGDLLGDLYPVPCRGFDLRCHLVISHVSRMGQVLPGRFRAASSETESARYRK